MNILQLALLSIYIDKKAKKYISTRKPKSLNSGVDLPATRRSNSRAATPPSSSQFPSSTLPASMFLPGLTVPLLLLLHPLLLTSSHAPSLSSWRCNQTASRSATKIQVHSHKVKQQGGPREETEKVVEQDEWNIDSVRRTKM